MIKLKKKEENTEKNAAKKRKNTRASLSKNKREHEKRGGAWRKFGEFFGNFLSFKFSFEFLKFQNFYFEKKKYFPIQKKKWKKKFWKKIE